jgi:thiol-disulfide isomerase/thioredoxin
MRIVIFKTRTGTSNEDALKKFRTHFFVTAISLAAAAGASAAVEEAKVQSAITAYNTAFTNSVESGERPDMAARGGFVDDALATISLNDLTLKQIDELIQNVPVNYAPKAGPALDGILAKAETRNDLDGAHAAISRLTLLDLNSKPGQRLSELEFALNHPAIAQAVAAGVASPIFDSASQLETDALFSVRPGLLKLADAVSSKAPTHFFADAAEFEMAIGHRLKPEDLKTFSPLREKLLAAADEKLKTHLSKPAEESLTQSISQLGGAFARGELVGFPAPEIDFLWSSNPDNPQKPIHSLADLKGKVVVLDFWATWCGPCVGSFPKVKALQRYYKGFDVVVLGVTSIQGFVDVGGKRVQTNGDQDQELKLLGDFLKEREVSWDIGVAKQSVFNPDYGVTGIPDVVIIDPAGVVRYAGLHPEQPLAEKTAIIDQLLSEAKLTIPAQMLMSKPTAEAN